MRKGQQTPKSSQTRSKIRAAALELFCSVGYDQSTMREIASRSGLSVGSTYYYFKTKEDLVLDFYAETQNEAAEHNHALVKNTQSFKKRLEELLQFRINQLTPFRSFIGILGRNAADRDHPLSPFGNETKSIRNESIELFSEIIKGSNLICAREVRPFLPVLLWLYQMGLVFFWIHDPSKDQSHTQILLKYSVSMVTKLIMLSKVPLLKPVNRSLTALMKTLGGPGGGFSERPV